MMLEKRTKMKGGKNVVKKSSGSISVKKLADGTDSHKQVLVPKRTVANFLPRDAR